MPRKLALSALLLAATLPFSAKAAENPKAVLVIHGGAGVIKRTMSAQDEAEIRAAMSTALTRGYQQLQQGKPALDAVTAAITVLEDSPHFNAGKGAVFTHEGKNELDSSIMEGKTRRAGAVAGVHHIRNPILAARAVMEKSSHVMLVGDGAEAFAKEQGITLVDPSYFKTEKRWKQLQKTLNEEKRKTAFTDVEARKHFGTVGAVALDAAGGLAAGTSTGGMMNKRWGRVGDSPIIGAGTWADERCGVSGTGWGEYYIRTHAASAVCERMKYLNEHPAQAGQAVINEEIPRLGGDGGAIVLSATGEFAFPFNTDGMFRGWIGADGIPHVAIFADEIMTGDQRSDAGQKR